MTMRSSTALNHQMLLLSAHNDKIYSTISFPVNCKGFRLALSFTTIALQFCIVWVLKNCTYVMRLGTIIIIGISMYYKQGYYKLTFVCAIYKHR